MMVRRSSQLRKNVCSTCASQRLEGDTPFRSPVEDLTGAKTLQFTDRRPRSLVIVVTDKRLRKDFIYRFCCHRLRPSVSSL